MDRIIIKPRLYRLAKAGKIQLMGGGRYSTVTATVTQEVKDKERKVNNSYLISNPNRYRRCCRYSAVATGQNHGRPRIAAPNGRCPAPAWFDPAIDSNRPRRAPAWFDPSIGPNGPCPASGPVPVAPNKLGAWGCGLVSTTSAG